MTKNENLKEARKVGYYRGELGKDLRCSGWSLKVKFLLKERLMSSAFLLSSGWHLLDLFLK